MSIRTEFHPVLRSAAPALLVAALVFAWYMVKPDNIQAPDSIWSPHVAASLIYERDPSLEEYRHWIEQREFYAAIGVNGELQSFFPIGGPILTVPQVIVLDAVLPELRNVTLEEYLLENPPDDPFIQKLQLINASFLVALSAGIMYLIGREYLRVPYALLLAATYAFGTSAYSTASRAMWQHGPSMLMLAVALLLLVKARKRPGLIPLVGLPLAAAFIIRPTNSVSVLVITIYVLVFYRSYFLRYCLSAALLAIPFVLHNISLYGSILPRYFSAGRLGTPEIGQAMAANLVSPARGVFVFSPILFLIPAGIAGIWRKRGLEPLEWSVIGIISLHWIVISSFGHWWAGHSFGSRFFADMMPFMIFLLIPFLELMQSPDESRGRRVVLNSLFVLLFIASVAIHYRGATSPATFGWNSVPINVDTAPQRVWDWSDLQFMRGLGDDLIATPSGQLTVESSGESGTQQAYFDVGRMTDGPVDLTIRLPGRVNLAEHSGWLFDMDPLPGGGKIGRLIEPLSGLGQMRFDLEVDTTNLSGPVALNAIQLVASQARAGGKTVVDTEVIALSTGPAGSKTADRPQDILVNCISPGNGELFALYGAGWYDEELAGDADWRWASSPAHLYVWSGERQEIAVDLVVSSLHDPDSADGLGDEGVFRVELPGRGPLESSGQSGQPLRLTPTVEKGWNTIVIELAAGNFRPADLIPGHYDTRDLSFSVDQIAITGACSATSAQP